MRLGIGTVGGQVGSNGPEEEHGQFVLIAGFAAQRLHFGMQGGVIFQHQLKLAAQLCQDNFQVIVVHDSLR
jgi:hypothetical protein